MQVDDNQRTLAFNVAQQFIAVLLAESTLELAQQDVASFQQTVNISEARVKAGDMSEGDLIKIKLQLLQFQSDVSPQNFPKSRLWRHCASWSDSSPSRRITM